MSNVYDYIIKLCLEEDHIDNIDEYLYEIQYGICPLCKKLLYETYNTKKDNFSIDHIIPLNIGKTILHEKYTVLNHMSNLQLTHKRCNESWKGNIINGENRKPTRHLNEKGYYYIL